MRYKDALAGVQSQLGFGLKQALNAGYSGADFRADAMAGVVVGVVALPLSMALAIASGVEPQRGLYTAIVAGIVCGLLGGTRAQITGPTAAFVVILAPIVQKFGVSGLLIAGMMAGFLLVAMALARLGRLIQYIPHPVTTGFTAGIAVVIATIQIKDFLGLRYKEVPDSYIDRWRLIAHYLPTTSKWELGISLFTLALLVGLPRIIKRVPAPLIALSAAALLAFVMQKFVPGFHVETIASRFGGIPSSPPHLIKLWAMAGPSGATLPLNFHTLELLLPSAFAIAMLGAIESLLAAVVSDGMTGTKHDSNSELLALGIGNIICPFFGGIAATGALARTATNIRAGAKSPISSVVHALFVLACVMALAGLVGQLPMAALAALLVIVAKNMAEVDHFVRIVKVAPRSDMIVLVVCFLLTVIFDMVLAVSVGVVLAALLFMRRMADLTNVKLDTQAMTRLALPEGVQLYEIAGPLFFGAAQKAVSTLDSIHRDSHTVILYLGQVPVIDSTGLVALETLLAKLSRTRHRVIIAGLQSQPREMIERAGYEHDLAKLRLVDDLESAVQWARHKEVTA